MYFLLKIRWFSNVMLVFRSVRCFSFPVQGVFASPTPPAPKNIDWHCIWTLYFKSFFLLWGESSGAYVISPRTKRTGFGTRKFKAYFIVFWVGWNMIQRIVGCTPTNVPLWEIPIYPYIVGVYGLNPYISPISTMGTLLGVHPIVPWMIVWLEWLIEIYWVGPFIYHLF